MTLSEEEHQILERTKEILSSKHQHLSNKETLVLLCQELLERKDPIVVEERIQKKKRSFAEQKPTESKHVFERSDRPLPANLPSAPTSRLSTEPTPISSTGPTTILSTEPNPIFSTTSRMEAGPSQKALKASTRRFVLARDQSCQWVNPFTRQKCGSKFSLQVDHRQPQWASGSHQPENLQVLCSTHNRLKYQREAGIVRH